MNKQKPARRGINVKLVLILSVLISLFVREVFGARVNTVVVPLDFVGQYRAVVKLETDGTLALKTEKKSDVTPGAALEMTWVPLNHDSSNIDRRILERLRLQGTSLTYSSQTLVNFRIDSLRGLMPQSIANTPLGFGAESLLDIDSYGSFYSRLAFDEGRVGDSPEAAESNTRRARLALFGQSLERFFSFTEIWSLGIQAGSVAVGMPGGPSVALARTRTEDLLRIRDFTLNWPMSGVRLPSDLALTSVTRNVSVVEPLVKSLFEKLSHMRVGYIELTTPHAIRPDWLDAFSAAAAPLEVQTGIRVRLIARIDTQSPTELQIQLNELAKTAKGQPYLAGFYLPSSEEWMTNRIRNFLRTVRPNLTLEGSGLRAPFQDLSAQEIPQRMVERIQYRELGFLISIENMQRGSTRSLLEKAAQTTRFRVATADHHCASLLTVEAM